jgi:hypothetical protein
MKLKDHNNYIKSDILVLEKHHSKWIYYLGWVSFVNSLIGFYNGYYDTAFMLLSAFLTCINYWRHPIYGFRRNLDITVTSIVVSYNLVSVVYCQKAYLYHSIGLGAAGIYFIGVLFYNKNYIGLSTLLHCTAHLGAILCNYLLFTNNICIK